MTVTDDDRAAAAEYVQKVGWTPACIAAIRAGDRDAQPSVEAFAAHRIAAEHRGYLRGVEDAAKVADAQRETFLSPEYATGQPLSSICERLACTLIADQIRALKP